MGLPRTIAEENVNHTHDLHCECKRCQWAYDEARDEALIDEQL